MAEAVLFDLDGTLIDSEPVWAAANTALVRSRRAEVTDELLRSLSGLDATVAMRRIHQQYGWVGYDVQADVDWVQRRVRESYARGVHWLPGARSLLASVRAAGLKVALVTSTYRELVEYVLAEAGPGTFDAVVCGDDGHRPKPDPAPYLAAMDALGLGPAGCVAVEDSAVGVASAHVAGCAVLNIAPMMRSDLAHTWAPSLFYVGVSELRAVLHDRAALHRVDAFADHAALGANAGHGERIRPHRPDGRAAEFGVVHAHV
ncbi:HAD family phosphatase [Dactylosporangium vinaceum]|uniref:HAD family hydrolase n=1 Tax=Dactylosporangium vinaceum TaxID=53362 RepID=A0ABV5MQQ7_9ACTN|nr:HAD family phosphatase [Dactylosporangium vinaceum]UAB96381.1 HAD family phosphatase [Dactylosporangium vinaceum]